VPKDKEGEKRTKGSWKRFPADCRQKKVYIERIQNYSLQKEVRGKKGESLKITQKGEKRGGIKGGSGRSVEQEVFCLSSEKRLKRERG